MNKTWKVVITLVTFTLVVLYFVQACGGTKPVGNVCKNFNEILLAKTAEYFSGDLPVEDGEIKTTTINNLVAANKITLSDLKDVGTVCSGNVYVSKGGSNYYYSTDVTCGSCSTSSLYTVWSSWTDTLPTLLGSNSQVQTGIFYNYGKGELKYSDWSDWGLTVEELKEPTLPEGVTVANTEKKEKTQYSYRDGSFKWYKLTGTSEYYGDGEYLESSPGSAYSKDNSTKKVSRTETNTSKSVLTSSLAGLTYDAITTITGYRMQTPKYLYIYNKPTGCSAYKPYVKCYKTTGTYTLPSCTYSTASAALTACNAQSNVKNCSYSTCSTTSGGTWSYNFNYDIYGAGQIVSRTCSTICSGVSTYYSSCSVTALKSCLLSGNVSYSRCSSGLRVYWSSSTAEYYFLYKNCELRGGDSSGIYPNCSLYSCSMSSTNSGGTTTITYKYTNDVIEYYNSGQLMVQGTCPTSYPTEEVTSNPSPECKTGNSIYTLYYLKADGSETTTKSLDAYLSDAEYAALVKLGKGTNYSKSTSDVTYDSNGSYVEGTCPSGTKGTTCSETTLYKTTVYKFKWYKTSTSSKVWYNDGAYSTKSPGSGYQPDIASANWGEWSEFSDTKVSGTSTRQVKTQVMKRIRKSYLVSGSFYLDNFLPLDEFEVKSGKTLAELSKDTSLIIQKKTMYRYRTLNQ